MCVDLHVTAVSSNYPIVAAQVEALHRPQAFRTHLLVSNPSVEQQYEKRWSSLATGLSSEVPQANTLAGAAAGCY